MIGLILDSFIDYDVDPYIQSKVQKTLLVFPVLSLEFDGLSSENRCLLTSWVQLAQLRY